MRFGTIEFGRNWLARGLAFATLGALLLISAHSVDEAARLAATEQTSDRARGMVGAEAAHWQATWAETREVLDALSGIALQNLPRTRCDALLARQIAHAPHLGNLLFVDSQGLVRCNAKPVQKELRLPSPDDVKRFGAVPLDGGLAVFRTDGASTGRPRGAIVAVLETGVIFPDTLAAQAAFQIADDNGSLLLTRDATPANAFATPSARLNSVLATQPGGDAALPLQFTVRVPLVQPATPWYRSGIALASALLVLAVLLFPWRFFRPIYYWLKRWACTLLSKSKPSRRREDTTRVETRLLRSAFDELQGKIKKQERRVLQLLQLDELSQRLQRCVSASELAQAVAVCAQSLFPGSQGALFLHVDEDRFGLLLAWGGGAMPQSLRTLDCHGLHTQEAYASVGGSPHACAHAQTSTPYACLPLAAPGGLLGLLYLAKLPIPNDTRSPPWPATAIAERASASLASLRRQEQWQNRAIRDALTGLFNRGFMEEALTIELQRALRRNSPIGIMLLDVDHFKRYNDTHGHAAGDALLRGLGAVLRHAVREGDMPCRYGGEEFVIILPGASLADTRQRAEMLRSQIAAWRTPDMPAPVTASIGVAAYPQHGSSWQAVLQCADRALYAAKHAGRNRVMAPDESEGAPLPQ